MFPYTATNESITIVIDGRPQVVSKGKPQYAALLDAILKDDEEGARRALTLTGALSNYLAGMTDFSFDGDTLKFKGEVVDEAMTERISQMATNGESPLPLLRFYARLQNNPSMRSVQQLWPFLKHQNIPIEEDGTFLAYKGVKEDLTDCHSGTVDNTPGVVNEMPRNKISDDPNHACHYGYHVGALQYATGFGPRTVIVRVDPEHVVCVPYDYSAQKMRVCKYEVVGFHTAPLSSTTVKSEDVVESTNEEWDGDPDEEQDETEDVQNDVDTVEPKTFFLNENQELPPAPRRGKRTVEGSKLRRFNKLSPAGLLEETIDDLRAYASKLKIVGASKLAGGKVALVKAITKARRKK